MIKKLRPRRFVDVHVQEPRPLQMSRERLRHYSNNNNSSSSSSSNSSSSSTTTNNNNSNHNSNE